MTSASPRSRGANYLVGKKGNSVKRERSCKFAERARLEHAYFADETLCIEEADLRKIGDSFAVFYLAEREVEAAAARMTNQSDAKKRLRIERPDHEHGTIVFLAGTVELVAVVEAGRAPPISRA